MARDLQEQIAAGVRDALAQLGIALPGQHGQATQTDYMEFGSDEHRCYLGLVLVDKDDDPTGYTTYTSQSTKRIYRLEDEIGVVSLHPGMDPEKAAIIVLRQKINELEGGPPPVPDNAPSLWQPVDQFATRVV